MLNTTDTSIPTLLKSSLSIESLSKVTMEINYNSIYERLNTGCYLTTYSSEYDSSNANDEYDDGKAYQFFDAGGVDTTMSGTSGTNTITVSDTTGIAVKMRVSGESIPADSYVTNVNTGTGVVTISTNISDDIAANTPVSFFTYKIAVDKDRDTLTPISSMFSPNRPDPGIVNLVSYRKGSGVIPIENMKIGNLGSIYNGTTPTDRIYPISKTSKYKYWNSVRKIKVSNRIKTVGLSNSSRAITHAAPFTVYDSSFYANKIVVKTQKYDGNYPASFEIEYLPYNSDEWTLAKSFTDSSELADGILEIYYNGSTWSTTPYSSNKFESTDTNAVYMRGIRFAVTKMSKVRIPLEVIEISPRLLLDVTDYTMSLDYTKSINNTSYGMPIAGTVSGSGSLKLSNVDKYFSFISGTSIIKDCLVQGIEIKMYQTINSEDIPLGTFYTTDWSESNDTTVRVSFEDYFYFLKRISAPEISIANLSGIEASVALLILFDNAGITNYRFIKQSSVSDDDFVFDYFFSDKTQTLADVVEQIAISAQYAIYVDANNIIRAVTKEKMSDLVGISDTDFWIVGTEDWTNTEDEYSYLNNNYVANTVSISENKIIPITEANIDYAGIGIVKQTKEILKKPELFNDTNVPYYNASIVNRGLSFVNTELWSIDSADVGSDKVLLSIPYISEISSGPRPVILNTETVGNNNLTAKSQNDLIRTIYSNASEAQKKYFEIVLDQERGTEVLQSQKFNGHVVIDAELIKYNGIVINVFDEKTPQNSGRFIVFDNAELQYLRNKCSSGVSILCYSILVEILYKPKNIIAALGSNEIEYEFVSDGRAQENTSIAKHTKQTETELTSNIIRTKLYSSSTSTSILPIGTMSAKSVNLLDPRKPKISPNTVSYPGYLKISGPKSISGTTEKVDFSDTTVVPSQKLSINNFGEQHITGFYKNLDFSPHRIATRMRLLEKPKKDVFTGTDGSTKFSQENRGIAGIGFRLKTTEYGTSGYFIEIEEVGNITGDQLLSADFANLRLYKVLGPGYIYPPEVPTTYSVHTPIVLAKAWVNVSAVSGESIDFGSVVLNEGSSYAGTSDLSVVIESNEINTTYKIYWESNLVCQYTESNSNAINKQSTQIGMIVRSDSEAMFDYFLATSLSKNENYRVPVMLSGSSEYITEGDAAERGMLPVSVTSSAIGNNKMQYYYEDFGNQMRECKKFTVSFQKPSVLAKLISLTKTNKDYHVSDFSYSSYGAEFWVFNTGRSSIGLSMDMNTPLIISGIALEEINPGTISLTDYLKNKSSSHLDYINLNKNKYGENSVSLSGNYINNLDQAQKHLEWIYNKCGEIKKEFDISMFPNPLIELGDKIRIYNSDINHTISLLGTDKVYYVCSISYSVSENGPEMNIRVREI